MGPNDIPGFARAQYRYDMHYDQPEDRDDADAEDFETEDDIPTGEDEDGQEAH